VKREGEEERERAQNNTNNNLITQYQREEKKGKKKKKRNHPCPRPRGGSNFYTNSRMGLRKGDQGEKKKKKAISLPFFRRGKKESSSEGEKKTLKKMTFIIEILRGKLHGVAGFASRAVEELSNTAKEMRWSARRKRRGKGRPEV